MHAKRFPTWGWLAAVAVALAAGRLAAEEPWVVYEGFDGPGSGKHVVLVSGDEEYRSEEALPQLGKILAVRHGFRCTVLFAIDPADGTINQPSFFGFGKFIEGVQPGEHALR